MLIGRNRAFTFLAVCLVLSVTRALLDLYAADGGDVVVQNSGDSPPQLFFACDGSAAQTTALLTPELVADLRSLGAGIALPTDDLSDERAALVERLNAPGVPVVASLTLPPDQGYYINAGNAPQTLERFEGFDRWSGAHNLRWQAVGLDIEPNLSEFAALGNHKLRLARLALNRWFDWQGVRRARESYSDLIGEMQSRGYFVETYQFPLIADERDAHSTFLERVFQLVDVRGNDEALMVYTSFHHSLGAALVWEYGQEAQMVILGITESSGDPAMDARFPPLNWQEFSQELIVARHFSPLIGVYNLQGAVQQGFITKLMAMNWNAPVVISPQSITATIRLRRLVRFGLWIGSSAPYLAVVVVLFVAWIIRLLVRRKRKPPINNH
jgi:hypothetical protein